MLVQIQFRTDTHAEFLAENPVLAEGEPIYVRDRRAFYIGDGITAYSALVSQSADPAQFAAIAAAAQQAAADALDAATRAEAAAGGTVPATTTVQGVSRYATNAEAIAGTEPGAAVTPVSLAAALATVAPASHSHPVTQITATGTRSATTFLRGDGTWATPAGGGGGASAFDDLTDVTLTAPATGNFIRFNGTAWVNYVLTKTDVALGNVTNTSDANKPVSSAQEARIQEVVNLHINDTTAAHTASAISRTPTSRILSTDVEAALVEVDAKILPQSAGPPGPMATKELTVFLAGEITTGISDLEPTIYEPHRVLGVSFDVGTPPTDHRLEVDVQPNRVSLWNTTASRPDLPPTGVKRSDFHPPDTGGGVDRGITSYRFMVTDAGESGGVASPPALVGAWEGPPMSAATTNFDVFSVVPAGTLTAGRMVRVVAAGSNVINIPAGWTAGIADATTTATHGVIAERTLSGTTSGTNPDIGLFVSGDGTGAQSSPIAYLVEVYDFAGTTIHQAAVSPGVTEVNSLATPTLTTDSPDELASWYIFGRTDAGSTVTDVVATGVAGVTETGDVSTTRAGATTTNFFVAGYSKFLATAGAGGGSLTGTPTTSPAAAGARMGAMTSRIKRRSGGVVTAGKNMVIRVHYQPLSDTPIPGGGG